MRPALAVGAVGAVSTAGATAVAVGEARGERAPNPVVAERALLRLAGLPVGLWLQGGCPELFARCADAGRRHDLFTADARALASWLSEAIIPLPTLARPDRRTLIALRRALHAARLPLDEALVHGGALLLRGLGESGAALRLASVLQLAGQAEDARQALVSAFGEEQDRVRDLGWRLLRSSPSGLAVLAQDGQAAEDVTRRLAGGEAWESKRLRSRGDHLWRLVGRACLKTTPRSWLGHVGMLPLRPHFLATPATPDGSWASPLLAAQTAAGPLPRVGTYACHEVANVHAAGELDAATGAATDPAAVRLSLTGLHWREASQLACWVPDPADRTRMRQLTLTESPVLRAVTDALTAGPMSREVLLSTLLPAGDDKRRTALDGFVSHLVGLGLLQERAAPAQTLTGWHDIAGSACSEAATSASRPGSFTDVYRRLSAHVPAEAAGRAQAAMPTAFRLAALVRGEGRRATHPVLDLVDTTARPVSEIIRSFLDLHPGWTASAHPAGGWPAAHAGGEEPQSPYGRLLSRIADHAGRVGKGVRAGDAGEAFVVDDDLLDELGAPPAPILGPFDCLLHPLPAPAHGPVAVVETAGPAGRLDARFRPALEQLHGPDPDTQAHRDFLRELERRLGGRFVEVLVPPLSERAANAVRRPVYTTCWTGDSDPAAYYPDGQHGQYLPLHRITMRREGERIVAESESRPVWPVYHATRTPLPPWDVVLTLLTAAHTPVPARAIRLGGAIAAFPALDHLPRITIGDDLVVTRAQWRVRREELWHPDAPPLDKVRALEELTRLRGLPRFVFAAAEAAAKPVPADLASLAAVRALERLARLAPDKDLVVEEMLPGPDDLLLADSARPADRLAGRPASRLADRPADRLAAQLLLRLPLDTAPRTLAARLAGVGPTDPTEGNSAPVA